MKSFGTILKKLFYFKGSQIINKTNCALSMSFCFLNHFHAKAHSISEGNENHFDNKSREI